MKNTVAVIAVIAVIAVMGCASAPTTTVPAFSENQAKAEVLDLCVYLNNAKIEAKTEAEKEQYVHLLDQALVLTSIGFQEELPMKNFLLALRQRFQMSMGPDYRPEWRVKAKAIYENENLWDYICMEFRLPSLFPGTTLRRNVIIRIKN